MVEIEDEVGVSSDTLWHGKNDPVFIAYMASVLIRQAPRLNGH